MAAPLLSARWLRPLAWIVAVLSLTTLAASGVARGTVLSPGFYGGVLADEHAYQRFYDEVLVDPRHARLTNDLLGRLPVARSPLTANVKVVIPPETLRAMTERQITEVVRYLEGDRDRLRLTVDLAPLVENVETLSRIYFADAVAAAQQRPEPDFAAFVDRLSRTATELLAGRAPATGLPSLALSDAQAESATTLLLRLVPRDERARLRPEVATALRGGDVDSALAAIAPVALSDRNRAAAADLFREAGGRTWVITTTLAPPSEVRAPVRRARSVTRLVQNVVEPAAAVLAAAAFAALWVAPPSAPRPTRLTPPRPFARRLTPLGWALAAAGSLLALGALLLRLVTGGGPLVAAPSSWAPSVARLVEDIEVTAVDRLLTTATVVAVSLLGAGALLVAVAWAWQTRPTLSALSALSPRMEHRRGLTLTVVASTLALAGMNLAPVTFAGSAPDVCQGSSRLCDLRYDEIAHLASHNAMASTADRFIGPLQDPDVVGQLNAGVRALLLDTHHWERPGELADRLSDSEFSPALREQLAQALARANPPRPGLWLCHSACGAGAVELVPTLRRIGDWLRDHPTEVVTLIVQDGIGAGETARAFTEAGLTDLLYEPDEDPDQPWPELGEMISGGHRLVVFAEKADGPAPWYRNFYRYGMETPFAVRSPDAMTCEPNRGGTDKRLFLLNHFVTSGGGRRLDAGVVNSRQRVLDRAHACERQRGRPVTFIAVDYVTVGEARAAVHALNAERADGR
ncbi:PI-PLC domain-containing protein [Streptomyces sp. NPDC006997]|uniref:PI-PLC domain-containing protein n=1 Tax=Streptomyces sp. NPDC006997 TaxID=3155356 RepID=UPI0033C40746